MLASQYVIHSGAVFQVSSIQAPSVGHYKGPESRRSVWTLTPLGGGVPTVLTNPTLDQVRLVPACTLCGTPAGTRCWARENGAYVTPTTCTDTTAALIRRANLTTTNQEK
jgi:hypothetical protein